MSKITGGGDGSVFSVSDSDLDSESETTMRLRSCLLGSMEHLTAIRCGGTMMVPVLCRAWPRVMQRFKSLHNAACSNGSHQRASEGQSEGNTTGLCLQRPLAPPRSEPAESRLGRGPWAP